MSIKQKVWCFLLYNKMIPKRIRYRVALYYNYRVLLNHKKNRRMKNNVTGK